MNPMLTRLALATLPGILAGQVPVPAVTAPPVAASEARSAAQKANEPLVRKTLLEFQALQAELAAAPVAPVDAADHRLLLGQVHYFMCARLPKADAKALVEASFKFLEKDFTPEAKALKGAFYGMKIQFSPFMAISYSSKANGLFDEALKAEPDNPRALIFKALHVWYTPSAFGGGAARTLPVMEKAYAAALAEPRASRPWAPSWGLREALRYLSMLHMELGHRHEALAMAQKLVELDPGFGALTLQRAERMPMDPARSH